MIMPFRCIHFVCTKQFHEIICIKTIISLSFQRTKLKYYGRKTSDASSDKSICEMGMNKVNSKCVEFKTHHGQFDYKMENREIKTNIFEYSKLGY